MPIPVIASHSTLSIVVLEGYPEPVLFVVIPDTPSCPNEGTVVPVVPGEVTSYVYSPE